MGDKAPLTRTLQARVAAQAAAVDATQPVAEAPFAGTVTSVSYTPDQTITGVTTNNRTLSLINKGQDGSGNTVIATLAFNTGVNAPADDEKQIPLSGVAANLVVAAGDILAFASVHGGTGLADPGGLVQVGIDRS